jgi:hypothetical protein
MGIRQYCCERFAEAIKEKEIIHVVDHDETEWFIDGLWHIYIAHSAVRTLKGRGGANSGR